MLRILRDFIYSLIDHYQERMPFIAGRMRVVALVGAVGFPAYYFIWVYAFPQPYESLSLRLLMAVMSLLGVPHKHLGLRFGKFYPLYLYVLCIVVLPAFFTYMLLANEANAIWLASTMIGFFVLPLLVDWRNMLIITFTGIGIGFLGYGLAFPNVGIPVMFWSYLPVLGFALLCGVAFNIGEEMMLQHRHQSMTAISANMAHEMRTPLLTVRSAAEGMRYYWPILTRAYHQLEDDGELDEEIDPEHWEALEEALDHVISEVDRMNAVVNMVLMNLRGAGQPQPLEYLSMASVVKEAIGRYPFDPGEERKLHLDLEQDFHFQGRNLLVAHILFNLLKNAYFAIAQTRKGEISLRLETGNEGHQLIFRDTASGISAHVLRRIFEPFYTTRDTGTGVGLSFCARAMEDMGGEIRAQSEEGEYTEFTLWFPVPEDQTSA